MTRSILAVALAGGLAVLLAGGGPVQAQTSPPSHLSTHATQKKAGNTRYVRRTCKTDACRQKHPKGTYLVPVKPKKTN